MGAEGTIEIRKYIDPAVSREGADYYSMKTEAAVRRLPVWNAALKGQGRNRYVLPLAFYDHRGYNKRNLCPEGTGPERGAIFMETSGADLSFVNLGITIEHLRNSVSVFGFRIAFYGIIIGLGMLAGMAIACSDAKRRGQDPEMYLDFALYAIIFAIVGARAYYVIFQWADYKDNLLQIFNLRAGGLAIYGGVIGGVLTLIVFCRVRKQSFFSMADSAVLGLITGQIMGRWGNFFNCEAFGGYTNNLFAMRIKKSLVNPSMISEQLLQHEILENGISYIQVHPTFLYESLWNLCVLAFMLWYRERKRFDGEMLWIYFMGYGLGRLWIESLRTDQLKVPGTAVAVSQLLSAVLVISAAGVMIYNRKKLKKGSKVGE